MFGGVYVECSLEDAGRLAAHLGYCLCIHGLSVLVCCVVERIFFRTLSLNRRTHRRTHDRSCGILPDKAEVGTFWCGDIARVLRKYSASIPFFEYFQ